MCPLIYNCDIQPVNLFVKGLVFAHGGGIASVLSIHVDYKALIVVVDCKAVYLLQHLISTHVTVVRLFLVE